MKKKKKKKKKTTSFMLCGFIIKVTITIWKFKINNKDVKVDIFLEKLIFM